MATGPLLGPPPQTAPQTDISPSLSHTLSWEGDRMFNIYIYDYCNKRGYRKTARELLVEADISTEAAPPIDARQGLLFEWWSVFWVLFTAKSNGTGPDDAMLYLHHHAQRLQRMQQQPPPNTRYVNGMQRPPSLLPNGQLPNGVGPPMQGAPSLAGSTGPTPFQMSGSGPHPNGMQLPSGPQSSLGPGATQPPNYSQILPGQRPGGPQRTNTNGVPPFQSPIMANSPQNPGQPHPMGQLGPSPHMMAHMTRGAMLPPNGPPGMAQPNPMTVGQQLQGQGSFQQRPGSRSGTPITNQMMTQPSPSLAARQLTVPADAAEINRLPPALLAAVKQEAGLTDRDDALMTPEEKQRLLQFARRPRTGAKPANAAAGPSGAGPSMQPPPPRGSVGQVNPTTPRVTKRNSTSPGEAKHEQLPRTDSSPPDRKRLRRSPLEQGQGAQQAPPQQQQGMMPQQPPPPTTGAAAMQMRPPGAGPPNGFPPHGMPYMGNAPGMAMPMGPPPQGHTMSPAMTHQAAVGMMSAQYGAPPGRYHPSIPGMPKPGAGALPGSIGSPAATDPSFGAPGAQPGQFPPSGNRMPPNAKSMGAMPLSIPTPKDALAAKDKIPPEGSPRNVSQNASQAGGQAATATTVTNPGATAPPTPGSGPSAVAALTAPSPSAVLNNAPTAGQGTSMDLFTAEYIQTALDDFDPSMFTASDKEAYMDPEFEQWLNTEGSTMLDMK